ncbi:CU044_5270 family protein [Streptomyces sp. NPDC088387]|uniref:CU044_5270 family protein n=1 Tax=Streptomyces sp. NPDC088387 TaxID=3365859 RepID=UPI0038260CF4
MNDTTASASPGDRDEITRLLPVPDDQDVPHEQYLRHRDLLMDIIDRDQASGQRAQPVRRLLRPAVLAPVAALGVACALALSLVDTGGDTGGEAAARDMRPAAALLDRISDAAERRTAPQVRDDQFVYTREKNSDTDLTSGKAVVGPLEDREVWAAQEPGPLHRLGLVRVGGEEFAINAELGDTEGTPAGFSRPTYRWLAELPTDPAELRDYLYAHTPDVDSRERDQAVFEQIGRLLGGPMPPRTAAALYRAAAEIPGVTRAPRAKDAIGRQGLGIARDDTRYGVHTEWVFDDRDYTFLGSRSWLSVDRPYGKAGTQLSGSAELEYAVVDKVGQEPAESAVTRIG